MSTGELPFAADDGEDSALFKQIANGVYTWPDFESEDGSPPPERSPELIAMVAALLRLKGSPDAHESLADAPMRLGAGPRGALEVFEHVWWCHFDFDALEKEQIPPPFIPELASDDDDSNFGPLEDRGTPVLDSPDYDNEHWDSFFHGW
mmetsp:Transcript_72074/g.120024  ORF Transcript_72074/g.120024 Transcript_72074/m.120024 type:complete len:149 (+) Transcript_72074:2-448(+)